MTEIRSGGGAVLTPVPIPGGKIGMESRWKVPVRMRGIGASYLKNFLGGSVSLLQYIDSI